MARLLQTQPGVSAITALAYVLTMGDVSRFPRGKQVASCLIGFLLAAPSRSTCDQSDRQL